MKHTWEEIRDLVAKEQKRQEDAAGGACGAGEGEGGAGEGGGASGSGDGSLMFQGKPLHRLPRTLERTNGKRK